MKSTTLLLAAMTLALPLSLPAAEHGHHAHGAVPGKLELNAGKKWPTDAPLRKGMSTMRERVATALPQAHAGKLATAQYEQLGQDLGAQIGLIVQNCKLDPRADAQLHVVLGDLMQGIDTLEGKQPGQERALGLVQAAQALNAYGKYFDHPGWKPVAVPD